MNKVKELYKEKGIELHPDTEKLTRKHINNMDDFPTYDGGLPGLHSEVQSLNQIYQKAGGASNLQEIHIGTKKSG